MSNDVKIEWVLAAIEQSKSGEPERDIYEAPHLYVSDTLIPMATDIMNPNVSTFDSAYDALEMAKSIQPALFLLTGKKYDVVCICKHAHPIRGLLYCVEAFSKLPVTTLMHPAVSLGIAQLLNFTNKQQEVYKNTTVVTKPIRSEYVFLRSKQDPSKPPMFFTHDGTFVEDAFDPRVVVWDSIEHADKYMSGVFSMSPELLDPIPIDRNRNLVVELAQGVSKLVHLKNGQQLNPLLFNALRELNKFIHADHIQETVAST